MNEMVCEDGECDAEKKTLDDNINVFVRGFASGAGWWQAKGHHHHHPCCRHTTPLSGSEVWQGRVVDGVGGSADATECIF